MEQLSDESLRAQLKAFGEDVGPLNNSTRPYWQKNLDRLKSKHCVSPIGRVSDNITKRRSQHKKETLHSSDDEDSNYSPSVNDLSTCDVETDSYVIDSPGSTPFPAKVTRKKTSSSSRNNLMKPPRIQHRDKELREKLKAYGVHMDRTPLNEATRMMWQKKLMKLMSENSPVAYNTASESPSEENLSTEEYLPVTNTPIRRRRKISKRYRGMRGKNLNSPDNSRNKNGFIQRLVHIARYIYETIKSISICFLRGALYALAIVGLFFILVSIISLIQRAYPGNDHRNSMPNENVDPAFLL